MREQDTEHDDLQPMKEQDTGHDDLQPMREQETGHDDLQPMRAQETGHDDLQPMRAQDTGQREVWGGLFFFYKAICHLQTTCLHFCIRIYRSGIGYMKMKKGLGFFPVNTILL